jgi:hypothetical protein
MGSGRDVLGMFAAPWWRPPAPRSRSRDSAHGDSAGLSVLVRAHQRLEADGTALVLAGVSVRVRQLMERAGVTHFFGLAPQAAEARIGRATLRLTGPVQDGSGRWLRSWFRTRSSRRDTCIWLTPRRWAICACVRSSW